MLPHTHRCRFDDHEIAPPASMKMKPSLLFRPAASEIQSLSSSLKVQYSVDVSIARACTLFHDHIEGYALHNQRNVWSDWPQIDLAYPLHMPSRIANMSSNTSTFLMHLKNQTLVDSSLSAAHTIF